ncbi:MAG: tRNA 2-methylthio-N6-isopentenyl adenosine(37) hydroxylase MiaE [Lutibacter sp.]|nr:MAG: tRNA 2-methylthio-N6-isopentenyl adenosine(37) hydroxylase MiaE [Lutibacter sp.]
MLGLKSTTNPKWAKIVEDNLGVFLTDHAFAEQKAAAGGFSLIIAYSEETELVKALSEYTIEETEHFKLVHDFMISRGYTLGRDQKSNYAAHLLKFFPKTKDRIESLVSRCLIAALIEARSCERFKTLANYTSDKELTQFYNDLIVSEAGHYTQFLKFARTYQDKSIVDKKWDELLTYEAAYMSTQGKTPLVHG